MTGSSGKKEGRMRTIGCTTFQAERMLGASHFTLVKGGPRLPTPSALLSESSNLVSTGVQSPTGFTVTCFAA
jgi:hypothetical protein